MDFIEVDFNEREFVRRVVEIIFEMVKIKIINFLPYVYGETIKVILNSIGTLWFMAF